MGDLGARHQVEQFAGEMRRLAEARGAEVEFARMGFRILDQFLHRLHRQRGGIDEQQVGRDAGRSDRNEIIRGIVGQAVIERDVDAHAVAAHQQRVAVGRRLGHLARADSGRRRRACFPPPPAVQASATDAPR